VTIPALEGSGRADLSIRTQDGGGGASELVMAYRCAVPVDRSWTPRTDEWRRQQGPKEPAVSERITWETCPKCGTEAALGWIRCVDANAGVEVPGEFDCPSGCLLTADELAAFAQQDE